MLGGFLAVCLRAPSAHAQEHSVAAEVRALGSYERSALQFALKAQGRHIEEAPEGKHLGRIVVVNLDVFGKAEGSLRWLNWLHVTTAERVISREVLLRPGDLWDSEIIAETQRDLKDPLFTSLVVVVPVRAANAELFDLLVVTRDLWSLRMNSTFEVQQGRLVGLELSVAENNILGLRKHGAMTFDMNQGHYRVGPQYIDKALFGGRMRLRTIALAIFSRDKSSFEGTSSNSSLAYPLWSLHQKWGAELQVSHANFISREYQGLELEKVDLTNTSEVEALPRIFAVRSLSVTSGVQRSFGYAVKQRLSFGHKLSSLRPRFVDGFEASGEQRAAFAAQVFPRSERVSALYARYRVFTPRYAVYRNLGSFDLAEDVRLGPSVGLGISVSLQSLGSDATFYQPDLFASYVLDLAGDGFLRAGIGGSSRVENGEFVDNLIRTSLKIATPRFRNTLRIVAKASLGIRLRERGNARFRLGGENGLRGYQIFEFSGQKQFLSNVELRSMPVKLGFARAGGLLFWDMGDTADRVGALRMKHSLGVGLRTLVPQLQPIVFRLDWAFPLQGGSAAFPGRISAGVAQVF